MNVQHTLNLGGSSVIAQVVQESDLTSNSPGILANVDELVRDREDE